MKPFGQYGLDVLGSVKPNHVRGFGILVTVPPPFVRMRGEGVEGYVILFAPQIFDIGGGRPVVVSLPNMVAVIVGVLIEER
jgi:hypothetical protein